MKWYIDYLRNEMARLQVDVRLNTEASVDMIKSLNPYAVLLATGAKPLIPDFEGIDLPIVSHYLDVKIENKIIQNKRIAVLGSGMVCHSTSRRLVEQGNEVTLVELPTRSGKKIGPQTRIRLMDKLRKMNVNIISGYKVGKILPSGLILEDENSGIQTQIDVDQVVIAMGVRSYNPLEKSLKQHMKNVFVIGDAAGYASSR